MRLDDGMLRDVLADAWERWARRCAELTAREWAADTRLDAWNVQALVAHLCPEPTMFDELAVARLDGPAAVTDAAAMLRIFNEPDGVANTTADQIAERAVSEATELTAETAAARFRECATRMRRLPEMTSARETVIRYPIVDSTTLAVVAELALMEATVHLLDFADAVGGVAPSAPALAATRDLLIAVPDPTAAVEVLAGRREPSAAVPTIR
ncbi:maleylpyruvate isomerase N-terminal domain-containing protein [Mycolicibacterium sp. XJ870]